MRARNQPHRGRQCISGRKRPGWRRLEEGIWQRRRDGSLGVVDVMVLLIAVPEDRGY